jgi:hypothetical protein
MHVIKVSTEIELIKDITLGLHDSVTQQQPEVKEKPKTRRKAS